MLKINIKMNFIFIIITILFFIYNIIAEIIISLLQDKTISLILFIFQLLSIYFYIFYINFNIVDEVLTYYSKSIIYGFLFSSFLQLLFLTSYAIFDYYYFIILNVSSFGLTILFILGIYKRMYELYNLHILDENLQQLLYIVN